MRMLEKELFADRRIKSLARKLARRTDQPDFLPAEIVVSATPDEWSAIADVAGILSLSGWQRGKNAVFGIPPDRRDPAEWAALREVFAPKERALPDTGETFRRARLIAPADVVEALKSDDTVSRFVQRGEAESREFLRLLEWAVGRIDGDAASAPTTLSQVGSDVFGDSKSVRSGARRAVLERIASAVAGMDGECDARDALARLGVEENPFTSSVTVFAPFSFSLETGEAFDHPARMFRAGLAVQLPRQTVLRIREVRLADGCTRIMTSENAAPFERSVRAGIPCLYTEGYPNVAVSRLLALFAAQGVVADHAGDGDLDGFIIADRVAEAIPVGRVVADELADSDSVSRRPVTPSTRKRWEAYLAAHCDFAHARSIRIAMERGWTEQESYGD